MRPRYFLRKTEYIIKLTNFLRTESSVVKESLTTAKDGKRYKTKMYNLETFRLHPYARDLSPRTTEEHQINPYPVVMTARFFCFFHSITV